MKTFTKLALLTAIGFSVSACGGGGSSGGPLDLTQHQQTQETSKKLITHLDILGKEVTIAVVDNFDYQHDYGSHGASVSSQISSVAPGATIDHANASQENGTRHCRLR